MSIFSNLFGPTPNTNQAVPAPGQGPQPNPNAPSQPGNIPVQAAQNMQGQQTQGTNGGGTVPALNNAELNKTAKAEHETPLAEFTDLWKNDLKLDANGKEVTQDTSVFGNIDQDALLKAAQTIDFTKDVMTPEILQAIQAGGEQGTSALMQAMNKVQQLTYAKSATVTTQLIERAISTAEARFAAKLPTHVRAANVNDLISQNPMYTNPSTRPVVDMVVAQLQAKYPNASTQEIDQIAGKYFQQFGSTLAPSSGNTANSPANSGKRSGLQQTDQDFSFMLEDNNPFSGH